MSIFDMTIRVLSGIGSTFIIFFSTLIISLPMGLVFMFLKKSRFKPLSIFMTALISILRCTPLMLQLIVWFYAPYYVFKINLSANWRIISIIFGFSINYAAYFSEIYRGGLVGIPVGQYEISKILGYKKFDMFIRIILPQLIIRVLPAVTNEIITLIKDTSLAFVIGFAEVFTLAKQVAAARATILPLFIAGIFYYVFNFIVERIMSYFEYKLSFFE